MNQSQDKHEMLQAVATILMWCFGLGIAVLLIYFVGILVAGDFIYELHSSFIEISREQFNAIHYISMTLLKTAVFMMFLFPYIGVKMAMKD